MSQTHYEQHAAVAVITLDNPPVNGLGHALRSGIVNGVRRANSDAAITAIVITGSGKAFSGGADIREFNTPKALAEPTLATVIREIEYSAKPVVAAVNAIAMGGGLELALGCHYRLAVASAPLALPEVKLGLLPGAGGTQRLPRVVPLETALNMIVSGTPKPAGELAETELIDKILPAETLLADALAFANEVVAKGAACPRVRDRSVVHDDAQGYLQFALNAARAAAPRLPAPSQCVEAVRGAVQLPFAEGLAQERKLFLELLSSPESRALRHAFFAERAARKIPDIPADTQVRPIKKVAVIGAGTMGGGIAMVFANAGIPVTLVEQADDRLQAGIGIIEKNYRSSAAKGRISAADVEERLACIQPTLEIAAISDCDLAIEAVFEDLPVKQTIFKLLDSTLKEGAILASNTSTLDLNQIADVTERPESVVGMHFFSPAHVMRLLEVVRGEKTAADVLLTVMGLARKIGKTAVVSGVCDGFIGNRMLEQYMRQATFMLEEGASPAQVDQAIEAFGFAMGPFRMSDLAGNDISWAIRKRRYIEKPAVRYSAVADRLCEAGRFGQKTSAGWYRYEPGSRTALVDPAVDDIVAQHRRDVGAQPRDIDSDEIVHRLVFALLNEGAVILQEGIALRASDIDLAYLSGYGFPLSRGGPMLYADQCGLYNVINRMNQFQQLPTADPDFWKPSSLLTELAAAGNSITGTN